MKPIEIHYVIDILHHVIRGQALCTAASNPNPINKKVKNIITLSSTTQEQNINILIADDNEFCRKALVRLIEKHTPNLTICEDGQKAFEEYKKFSALFQLVILDYQMPFMSGIETIAAIREFERDNKILNNVPILCNYYYSAFF